VTSGPAEAISRAFARDDEGWPIAAIIAWLMTEGRLVAAPEKLLDALGKRLEQACSPVRRMRFALRTLHPEHRGLGCTWVRGQGVGLHVGSVIYGNVGAPRRLDFTVMGPAVNRTARLESLTKTLLAASDGPPLLMSADFARHIDRPVRSLGAHPMKGVDDPPEVLTLVETE
jgi:adenylate cyclase